MARRLGILAGILLALVVGGAGLIRFAGAGAMEFRVAGAELYMTGPVSGAAADRLERLLEANPDVQVVVLGDVPGADDAGWLVQMGLMIRARALDTRAEGALVNDGILLFAAGETRTLGAGTLVLHSEAVARNLGQPLDRRAAAEAERARYLEQMLGDAAFADFAAALRAERDQHVMTAAEIARFGLVQPD